MKKDYLSHYTNVDTLEVILSTKTIKLNRLKYMNDLNEGRNVEGIETEYIMYSSSWTEDKSEYGIDEMWDKYTENGAGVRITIERYPFKRYDYKGTNIINESDNVIRTYINPKKYVGFLDSTILAKNISQYKMLKKVIYTSDRSKYIPQVVEEYNNFTNIKIQELGFYKEDKWKNELEWRYLITLFNRAVFNPIYKSLDINEQIKVMGNFGPESLFLDLKGSSIRKMEVIMSKNISNKNKMKLYQLSDKYKFKIIN